MAAPQFLLNGVVCHNPAPAHNRNASDRVISNGRTAKAPNKFLSCWFQDMDRIWWKDGTNVLAYSDWEIHKSRRLGWHTCCFCEVRRRYISCVQVPMWEQEVYTSDFQGRDQDTRTTGSLGQDNSEDENHSFGDWKTQLVNLGSVLGS